MQPSLADAALAKRHAHNPKPENAMSTTTHNEPSRDQIDIEKIRAEIMNLMEDSWKKAEERAKMQDEREKLRIETKWHPLWVVAAIFGAGAALATALATALVGILKALL